MKLGILTHLNYLQPPPIVNFAQINKGVVVSDIDIIGHIISTSFDSYSYRQTIVRRSFKSRVQILFTTIQFDREIHLLEMHREELATDLPLKGKGFDMAYRVGFAIDIMKHETPREYYDHKTAESGLVSASLNAL